MKINILNFSLFFLLSLIFMSTSASAQATSYTTLERFPVAWTLTACNGEDILFEGFEQSVIHETYYMGQLNRRESRTFHYSGIGQTTGAKYVGVFSDQIGERFDTLDEAPFNFTTTSYNLMDVWQNKAIGNTGKSWSGTIPGHDVVLIKMILANKGKQSVN